MVATGNPQRQYVLVMRHGLRQDEVDPNWADIAERPWDPPLAESGQADVIAAAGLIHKYGIQKVVCSPFLRCLQTARILCKALHPQITTIEVDNSLCEILGPTYFAGAGGPKSGQTVENWLWGDKTPEAAWAEGLQSENIRPVSSGNPFPAVPEALPQAHVRYTAAIEAAANRANDQNLLIITHGEAVGRSVTRLLPTVSVFCVQHCGFSVAWRDIDEDGDYDLWELEQPHPEKQRGVFWRDRSFA